MINEYTKIKIKFPLILIAFIRTLAIIYKILVII